MLWLTECPAWETLRADLLSLTADGHDPVALLRQAANLDELDTARDPAAVLDYRLQLLVPEKASGPLPWLRGLPSRVAKDGLWGPYLQARADRVNCLADGLRREVRSHHLPPNWLGPTSLSPRMFENGVLLGDITIWRAVMDVPTSDTRATGAPVRGDAAARWQHDLEARLDRALGTGEWGRLLATLDPALAHDPERIVIARRLNGLAERGLDVGGLVERALGQGPRRTSAPPQRSGGASPASPRSGKAGRRLDGPRMCGRPSHRRRPEHDHLPGHGHDRHGPSIGF